MEEALALAGDVSRPASFEPVLILSHLACGDDPAAPMNKTQLELFRTATAAYEGVDASLSASAGIFLGPDYHFDLTRPGIALYGGDSAARHVEKAHACGNCGSPHRSDSRGSRR
nr:alanine racemase [Marinicella sp. W31]MDC2876864.1 alanine racemase [Marinicella sp. W31]